MYYTILISVFNKKTEIQIKFYAIMCVMLFGFGIIFLVLGIIGQYIAQMYLEIKNRPEYIIKEKSDNIK